MRLFGGAEIYRLVGPFCLSGLASVIGKNNVSLHRNDSLTILENPPGPDTGRIKNKIIKFLKQNGLKITIDVNDVQANFLDVTFDLQSDKYWPCRKQNNYPLYIYSRSNHPPSIKKQIPSMLADRLSQLSCNQDMFNRAAIVYQGAMQKIGHHNELENQHSSNQTGQSKKKENKKFYGVTLHSVST